MTTIILLLVLILLLFFKNKKIKTDKVLNWIFIANFILFISPLAYAFLASLPDGNMWSENGPGAVLWYYLILIPFCGTVQIVWFILKLLNSRKKAKENVQPRTETNLHQENSSE